LAGSATERWVAGWLAPVLIAASVLLLGRSFYILYVQRRGTRTTVIVTWLAAIFVAGYWTWQLLGGAGCPAE
jgi:hypothetical protein